MFTEMKEPAHLKLHRFGQIPTFEAGVAAQRAVFTDKSPGP